MSDPLIKINTLARQSHTSLLKSIFLQSFPTTPPVALAKSKGFNSEILHFAKIGDNPITV